MSVAALERRVERLEEVDGSNDCSMCADIPVAVRVIGAERPLPEKPFCTACGRTVPVVWVQNPYATPGQRR